MKWLNRQDLIRIMHRVYQRCADDSGVLAFEWVLLITLVVIGIVGGLSTARDAIIDEMTDIAGAIVAIDQSYSGFGKVYVDEPNTLTRCQRIDANNADASGGAIP